MCTLPNTQFRDPEELLPPMKKQIQKTKAKTVKIIVPHYPSMKNSI
jgi:hypothetical protein